MQLESHIAGIPCLIEVTHCVSVKGSHSYHADSDWDYYGYNEVEFDVLDRKGYRAYWLEKKMSAADKARIEQEILEYKSQD